MKILCLDPFAGISGDMLLGALVDLGVKPAWLEWTLSKLQLPEKVHLHASHVQRCGIRAVKLDLHVGEPGSCGCHDHGDAHSHTVEHAHDHGHSHRSFADIRTLIEQCGLSAPVVQKAIAVFHRIAVAEGAIHGIPPEEVTFHEVGAIDSIADIVLSCAALDSLGLDRIVSTVPTEGQGQVSCAHGIYPVPAPATLAILRGIPLRQLPREGEQITPTGAALLAEFASSFTGWDGITIEKIGFGAGSRDPLSHPNVLRLGLGTCLAPETQESVELLETNLDDCSSEVLADAQDQLFSAGALDVSVIPCQMKKGRSGWLLTVLSKTEDAARLTQLILTHTTAFGVRQTTARRTILQRDTTTVPTPWGQVQIKRGFLQGRQLQASPEFDSCQKLARQAGIPVRLVMQAAQSASSTPPDTLLIDNTK